MSMKGVYMKKIAVKRKLIRLGNSFCISIPSIFLKVNDMKKGDFVQIEGNFKFLKIRKAGSPLASEKGGS